MLTHLSELQNHTRRCEDLFHNHWRYPESRLAQAGVRLMYYMLGKANNEQAAVNFHIFNFLPFLRVAMSAQHIL